MNTGMLQKFHASVSTIPKKKKKIRMRKLGCCALLKNEKHANR